MMYHHKGFSALPLSLKFIFIVMTLGMLSSMFYFSYISENGYPLLWFTLLGMNAIVSLIILNILLTALLLFGMWNRSPWTWEYGIIYFGFFVINGIISFITLLNGIDFTPSMHTGIWVNIFAILFGTILNLVFLVIMYKKRFYFEEGLRF